MLRTEICLCGVAEGVIDTWRCGMINRVNLAEEKFLNGYNCSQAVLSAFCDLYGLDEVTAFKLSEGFGLGMGGYKDECGAVTGMFMTIGLANSDGKLSEGATKLDTYAKLKEAGEEFKEKMESLMCRDLLRKERDMKAAASQEQIEASKGKNLICIECVKCAAEILEKMSQRK